MRKHPNILWIIGESLIIGTSAFVAGYLWPHAGPTPILVTAPPPIQETLQTDSSPVLTSLSGAKGEQAEPTTGSEQDPGPFVASSSGKKYHPSTGCSYADRIKPENKIYFTSEQEARAAGYEPSTCLTK
ncbi:MAG: hypothetical protein Q8P33_00510 [bacterium]|nr:hypothetical protein [bacterium]